MNVNIFLIIISNVIVITEKKNMNNNWIHIIHSSKNKISIGFQLFVRIIINLLTTHKCHQYTTKRNFRETWVSLIRDFNRV